MSNDAGRGRKIVLTIIGATLVISALVIIRSNLLTGPHRLPQQVVRFILTVLLAFFLYRGANWARWLLVILYGLGGVGSLGLALFADTGMGLLLVVMGVCYVFSAGALVSSSAVAAFLAQQRCPV